MTATTTKRAPRKKPSTRPAGRQKKPLLGSEKPRIFTPPKRPLTRRTTHGYEAIEFAQIVLGINLYPWQQWMLKHALELNPDGTYRFRTIVLLVARQNGKSTLLQVLSLWRMYVDGAPLVIGTAQNLDIAEEIWTGAVAMAEANDELAAEIQAVDRTNGKKALRLAANEAEDMPIRRYKVAAATRKGGRGLSGDLVLLDELREHSNWDAWGAVTKTTMARPKPQVWAASNAGDASSVVLKHLRKQAVEAIESGETDDETLGLFEWSAPEDMPTSDRRGWAMANPTVGWGFLTEEALESAHRTDPDPIFRVECLCQWVKSANGGPWKDGHWDTLADRTSKRDPEQGYYFGVDVSWDRSSASVVVVAPREDGKVHVEIVAERAGTNWLLDWLRERKDRDGLLGVVMQANGAPVSSLITSFVEAEIPVVEWAGGELGRGTGQFYDAVTQGRIRHRDQGTLNLAAMVAATRPIADYWVWDRKKSAADITTLIAATAAYWALNRPVEIKRSAYDNDELMFV